jgi:hypothetical protein
MCDQNQGKNVVIEGVRCNQLYKLNFKTWSTTKTTQLGHDVGLNNLDLWHQKLTHFSNKNMKLIVQHKLVDGLPKAIRSEMKFCEGFTIWQVDGIP